MSIAGQHYELLLPRWSRTFLIPLLSGGGGRRKAERKKQKGQQKQKPQDTREKTKDGRNSKIRGRDIQYSTEGEGGTAR